MPREGYTSSVVSDVDSLSGMRSYLDSRRTLDRIAPGAPRSLHIPSKRRKSENLNSRFDRMAETVHALHRERSPPRRRRASSIGGSSSTASCDVPRTPIDAYSGLNDGRLGSEFSVIRSHPLPDSAGNLHAPDLNAVFGTPEDYSLKQVAPTWLQNTVASLKMNHALRSFISLSQPTLPEQSIPAPLELVGDEDEVFAFRPPTSTGADCLNSSGSKNLPPASTSPDFEATRPNREFSEYPIPFEMLAPSPTRLPYSTPGPGTDLAPLTWKDSHEENRAKHPGLTSTALSKASSVHKMSPSRIPSMSGSIHSQPVLSPAALRQTTSLPSIYEEDLDLEPLPDFLRSSSPDLTLPDVREPSLSPVRSLSPRSSDSASFPIPFSTPGPGSEISVSLGHPPQAPTYHVYFDSPTEDPTKSDPLERPDYKLDLDYDDLNFKWEKFDRSGLDLTSSSSSLPDHFASVEEEEDPMEMEYMVNDVQFSAPESEHKADPIQDNEEDIYHNADPPVFVSACKVQTEDAEQVQDPPEISSQVSPQPFAPAPGIYISPLRGEQHGDNDSQISSTSDCLQPEDTSHDKEKLTRDMLLTGEQANNNECDDVASFPLTKVTSFKTPSPQPPAVRAAVQIGKDKEADQIVSESDQATSSQESQDSIESWTNA